MPIILCIDDRIDSLKTRKLMLEMQGYSVLTADNGPSGLTMLADHSVDAVILDYKMEGMDGLAVATAVRARHGKLPIVLLSGYPTEIPKQLLEMVDAFIVKGQPPELLLGELRRITGGAKKPPAAEIAGKALDYLKSKKISQD